MLLRTLAAGLGTATAILLSTTTGAFAFTRHTATSLAAPAGQGWELLPVRPLVDLSTAAGASSGAPVSLDTAIPGFVREGLGLPRGGDWQPVTVPAAWEQTLGTGYTGAGWYRRTLSVPAPWLYGAVPRQRRVWLEFDAVAGIAGVWVNGQWCGGNVGDAVRWRVDITGALKPSAAATGAFALPEAAGTAAAPSDAAPALLPDIAPPGTVDDQPVEVALLVYVAELPSPAGTSGPRHGGIWQDCRLYQTGTVSIVPDGVRLHADPVSGELVLNCKVDADLGPILHATLDLAHGADDRILHLNRKENPAAFGTTELVGKFKLEHDFIKPWSPAAPELYHAILLIETETLTMDSVELDFGFRSIDTSGSQLRLNSEPLYLRSALNTGWYPGAIAPVPTPDTVRAEFKQLKALGFNAETLDGALFPDYFYDIADQEGLLLWQAYPAGSFAPAAGRRGYLQRYENYFRRDANHPSVILRSLVGSAGAMPDEGTAGELLALGRDLTDSPLQAALGSLAATRPAQTDWYVDTSQQDAATWAQYLGAELPGQLGRWPAKPFLTGGGGQACVWPDTAALLGSGAAQLAATYGRSTAAPSANTWPEWFPRCFDSVLATQAGLRARYNSLLPRGTNGANGDIVREYLLPESAAASLANRKFELSLLQASGLAAGYTLSAVHDTPLGCGGLLDDFGQSRWNATDWAWQLATPGSRFALAHGAPASADSLLAWDPAWDNQIDRSVPLLLYGAPAPAVSPLRRLAQAAPGIRLRQLAKPVRPQPQPAPPSPPAPSDPRSTPDREVPPAPPAVPDAPAPPPAAPPVPAGPPAPIVPAAPSEPGLLPPAAPVPAPLPAPASAVPPGEDNAGALAAWFKAWKDTETVAPGTLAAADPLKQHSPLIVSATFTPELADFALRGGVVMICTGQRPSGLQAVPQALGAASVFVPPVGPWQEHSTTLAAPGQRLTDRVVELQPFDLNHSSALAIPVDDLGLTDSVDPLLRLFDTSVGPTVVTSDQLFATRVGSGLLIVSSLDHGTAGGQWVLSKVLAWALVWKLRATKGEANAFPQTELSRVKINKLVQL